MRIDRTVLLTALAAIGAALVVFPLLPGSWPSPLAEGSELPPRDLQQLQAAAERVDLACSRGDLAAFEEAVTPAYRQRLRRQLEAIGKPLDAAALQQFHSQRAWSYADLLRRRILAAEVRGERAVVAVDQPGGAGARVLEFVWDGRRLRLEDSRHAVAADSEQRARAVVVDAAMRKSR